MHLSQSETPKGSNAQSKGAFRRSQMFTRYLSVSGWIGAELSTVAKQELIPMCHRRSD